MSPVPVRAALWRRVSTDEQESGNQLLPSCGAWAGHRGLAVVPEYVLDGASAWKGAQRDRLGRALDSTPQHSFGYFGTAPATRAPARFTVAPAAG